MGHPPAIYCADCCDCPAPTLQWDSVSASKSKCGFSEYIASTPPKRYVVETIGGGLYNTRCMSCEEGSLDIGDGLSEEYSGSCVISKDDCSTVSSTKQRYNPDPRCTGSPAPSTTPYSCFTNPFGGSFVNTGTTATRKDYHFAEGGFESCESFLELIRVGDTYIELSDEFTTAQLIANAIAALPAFDGDWNDTAGSFRDLSTDELSYSIRRARYRFKFKIPKVGSGECYKITWKERFSPEGGGSATDTDRCAIWDGSIPGDYDPDDSATWPVIGDGTNPYFELNEPEADGTITVVDVVAACTGCDTPCP